MPITTIPRDVEGVQVGERWFTVEQIALQLQVSEQTVRRWLRDGSIRGHSFGGKAGGRVKESDLNRFLETQRPSPDPPGERPVLQHQLRIESGRYPRHPDWLGEGHIPLLHGVRGFFERGS